MEVCSFTLLPFALSGSGRGWRVGGEELRGGEQGEEEGEEKRWKVKRRGEEKGKKGGKGKWKRRGGSGREEGKCRGGSGKVSVDGRQIGKDRGAEYERIGNGQGKGERGEREEDRARRIE